MSKIISIKVPSEHINKQKFILKKIRQSVDNQQFDSYKIRKRSIDARRFPVLFILQIEVFFKGELPNSIIPFEYKNVKNAPEVHIIGFGPAGMFAALRLIEMGFRPIVFERGKAVRERRRDLVQINRNGIVNPESNYSFGEGGAGTFSDGKLYTRSKKRGDVDRVLQIFVQFGADEDILVNARPHIGTNLLPKIVENIRNQIIESGGEIHFNSKLTDIQIESDKITKIQINNDFWLPIQSLILATGHSARDIYELLDRKNIQLEAKDFAMGFRIEHPQEIIDSLQYHCEIRDENLPPAYYSLSRKLGEKSIYSFCMCPGGIIAPASTSQDELVVNGWSPSKRNNKFANSGMVVNFSSVDFQQFSDKKVLAGMYFQQFYEQKASEMGLGNLKAPAQRLVDFVENKSGTQLFETSYLPGITSTNLNEFFPKSINNLFKRAFKAFGKQMKKYYTNEAHLLAIESRTSSPLRIPRDKMNYHHPQIQNLFPSAEGAGYAGGIVSAAIDGEKCAEAIAKKSR